MPDVFTATEAKVHFGELMRRVVERREPVYVERGGRPQVVVLAVADYERLLSCEEGSGWLARARQARDRIQAELAGQDLPPVEKLVDESREERDEQLDCLR